MRHAARACIALGLCLTLSKTASAGNVPSSALSLSLGMEPGFLDYPTLVFQYPQAVLGFDSKLLGLSAAAYQPAKVLSLADPDLVAYTDGNEYGLGGMSCTGPVGFFVLSQREYQPLSFYGPSTLLQVGAAARLGALRLGAAVRGSRDRNESGEEVRQDLRSRMSGSQLIRDHLEYAFGLGLTRGEARLDLVLELIHTTFQAAGANVSEQDTVAVQLQGESDLAPSGMARLTVPLGERARFVGLGGYREGTMEWQGIRYDSGRLLPQLFGNKSIVWSVGGAIVFPREYLDQVALSAFYERHSEPVFNVQNYILATTEGRSRDGILALSARRHLWRELSGQASVAMTYQYERTDEPRYYSFEIDLRTSRTERLSDRFAWGLSYTWKKLQLASSMSTTLRLDAPFVALDVQLDL